MSDKYYNEVNQNIVSQKRHVVDNENEITDDLLYYYDKKFDNNYDAIQKIDKSIQNKEAIITINQDEYENKNDIVIILQCVIKRGALSQHSF